MEWVRQWAYELVWQDGHTGVRGRRVQTVQQLRAVVDWARANPRVRRWTVRPVDHLIGKLATACRNGHQLLAYPHPHRVSGWLTCADCPGHHLVVCPTCGDRVIDPAPGPDCGPPAGPARRAP